MSNLVPEINDVNVSDNSNNTWKIVDNHLVPLNDNLLSIIQAAYLTLQTPRYQNLIFSWQYGSELHTLVGKDEAYVLSESRRMIIDALSTDNRIKDVTNFRYSDKVLYFTIVTIYGQAELSTEVIT